MLAVRLATVEEVVSDAKNTISPEFSQKLAELDETLKKNNCSKQEVTGKINALSEEIGETALFAKTFLQKYKK